VGLAVIAIVAVLAALHAVLARHLRRREAAWFEARSRYWSHIVGAIAYAGTVRFNSAHRFAEERFSSGSTHDLDAHLAVIDMSTCLDAAGASPAADHRRDRGGRRTAGGAGRHERR